MKQHPTFAKAATIMAIFVLLSTLSMAQKIGFFIPEIISKTAPVKITSCNLVNNFTIQCFELAGKYNAIVSNLTGLQNSLNNTNGTELLTTINDIGNYSSRFATEIGNLEPAAKNLVESFTALLDKGKSCVSLFEIPRVISNMTAGVKVVTKTLENLGVLSGKTLKELNQLAGPLFDTYKQQKANTNQPSADPVVPNEYPVSAATMPAPGNHTIIPAKTPVIVDGTTTALKKSTITLKNISFPKLQLLEEALKKMPTVATVTKKFNQAGATLEIMHKASLTELWNYLKTNTSHVVSDENITDWNEDANRIDLAILVSKS